MNLRYIGTILIILMAMAMSFLFGLSWNQHNSSVSEANWAAIIQDVQMDPALQRVLPQIAKAARALKDVELELQILEHRESLGADLTARRESFETQRLELSKKAIEFQSYRNALMHRGHLLLEFGEILERARSYARKTPSFE